MRVALLALLALGVASADGPEEWASMYDGRLVHAEGRDPAAAKAVYETVLGHLPADDPLQGPLQYWLARAKFGEGDAAGAREALLAAANHPSTRAEARTWLGRMDLETRRLEALPYTDDFAEGIGAFVRGWPRGREGDLTVVARPGLSGSALAWSVVVEDDLTDFLILGLGPEAGPMTAMKARVRTERFPAWVRVVLTDRRGLRWSTEALRIPTESWLQLDLGPGDFSPVDPSSPEERPSSGDVWDIQFVDVTALHSRSRGEHWLFLDDFAIE